MEAIAATQQRKISSNRRNARHAHQAVRHPRKPHETRSVANLRARVADTFRAQAHGTLANEAAAQATAFYRATNHAWTRALAAPQAGDTRARVASAFRRFARGVEAKAAYPASVAYYRSSGHDWTRHFG
jgi:hypothetical protein